MTNRVQNFRTPTTGVSPAAGTRAPGEVWMNFPDLQFGVIDTSRNAQKLIAVRYFSTAANYAVGDLAARGGSIYSALVAITAGAFSPAQWTKLLVAADLPPGNVPAMNDNRIINGDMRIDQRNNGVGGTAGGYTVDRWQYGSTLANKVWWGRNINSGSPPAGFPYYLGIGSQAAYTLLATDYFFLKQVIEADTVSDFAWGTPNAQSVTLSFWAYSSLTGTFSGSIQGGSTTRSYPFTYSLPTANIWTKIVVTIPGDTNAAWAASMSGNGSGPEIVFDVGSGSNFRGPANAWVSADYVGATGANSIFSVSGAIFYLTGVKFEIGSVATPFNRQSLAKSLVDCQRYYQFSPSLLTHTAYGQGSVTYTQNNILPVQMRAAPTAVLTNLTNVTNAASGAVGNLSSSRFISQAQVVATGQSYFYGDYALTAEL